jgi:PPM family protein phosphatase
MALKLNFGQCSLAGYHRENNEDSIDVKHFPDLDVCVVAAGMGGQAAGELVSKQAVEAIQRELRDGLTDAIDVEGAKKIIRRAIALVNEEIIQMSGSDQQMRNMGSTVVVAVFRDDGKGFIAGVGDSRAYLIRYKKMEQLTTDHALARGKKGRVLWKYLGTREVGDEPEVKVIQIQAGDRFLLCTDGLTGAVADAQILRFILSQRDVQVCTDALAHLALESGSKDNVSCIVIEVVEA